MAPVRSTVIAVLATGAAINEKGHYGTIIFAFIGGCMAALALCEVSDLLEARRKAKERGE